MEIEYAHMYAYKCVKYKLKANELAGEWRGQRKMR